ncbi:MAG: hypothetical protein ACRCVU_10985, partial [Flavobacterium sp.]
TYRIHLHNPHPLMLERQTTKHNITTPHHHNNITTPQHHNITTTSQHHTITTSQHHTITTPQNTPSQKNNI